MKRVGLYITSIDLSVSIINDIILHDCLRKYANSGPVIQQYESDTMFIIEIYNEKINACVPYITKYILIFGDNVTRFLVG